MSVGMKRGFKHKDLQMFALKLNECESFSRTRRSKRELYNLAL